MTKKQIILRYLVPLVAVAGFTACQSDALARLGIDNPADIFDATSIFDTSTGHGNQEKMIVNKVEFAPDYKTFSVWTRVVSDIGPYPLTDTSLVRIEVEEYDDGVKTARSIQPSLVKAVNTESDEIEQLGIKVLVLVDLSLSEDQIDMQRRAIQEMQTSFNRNNLFVSFMSGNTAGPSLAVSDYILSQYFKKEGSDKRLYRSILDKVREMAGRGEPWTDARQLKLVVFSDGKVYDDNDAPLDPDHFKIENELLQTAGQDKDSLRISYVNFGKLLDTGDDPDATNVLTSLCETTGGSFFPSFNWTALENKILEDFSHDWNSNRFDFVNPDRKVYRGDSNQIKLKFYSVRENKLIATATAEIREGTLYRPIIVHGDTLREILLSGLSIVVFLLVITYLIFQLLVPFVSYRLFKRKYVVRYTGGNMVMGDMAVAQSCYLCKAPFKEGDEIVVKCEHTMHKSCWDENEYHCPEYGRHCKEGSHFYDRNHPLDRRNASFYLKWLIMAIIAAFGAWVAFSAWSDYTEKHLLEYLIPGEILKMDQNGTHLNQLPFYTFAVAFFLTLGIAWLAIGRKGLKTIFGILLRSLAAGLGAGLLFLLTSVACIVLNLEALGFFINLVPWILSSFLVAFMGTYGTRIKLKKYIILVAVGLSLLSMNVWSSFYMVLGIDFRLLLLLSFMVYTIGMALAIATAAPRSEHYFLKVQGAVKTMEVALYKWFRANPNAIVTLGKSVTCSLQLSWDLQGKVAPIHAEISMKKGSLRLKALEEGVLFSGKQLKVDKYKKLYHGTSFQIGKTIFTYQEDE